MSRKCKELHDRISIQTSSKEFEQLLVLTKREDVVYQVTNRDPMSKTFYANNITEIFHQKK